jgi:hypothetical protein
MAPTNKSAALKARHANHGGPRKNSGRPLGAKDAVKRKGSVSEKERNELLQVELGKAYKEIERLRNKINRVDVSRGSVREKLEAWSNGEAIPTQEQLYSTKLLWDKEPPPVIEPPVTDKDKEENEREWQKLIEYFATFAIKEAVFQINGKPAGDAGVPHWVPALVSKVVAETQALLGVPLTEVVPARQRVFWGGQGDVRRRDSA